MNTACPTCGAVYNVAEKDIGRKLKCKKCSSALKVTDDGLQLDAGTGSASAVSLPPPPPPVAAALIEDDEEIPPVVMKKGKGGKFARTPRGNPLAAVGGIPTALFGFGVFLVIVFTSLPIIGAAGTDRARATVDKLQHEMKVKQDALVPRHRRRPTRRVSTVR